MAEYWVGLFASAFGMAPLEVLKLRLQCSPALVKARLIPTNYDGISDCFQKIAQGEGWRGFFKGNATKIIKYTVKESSTIGINLLLGDLRRSYHMEPSFVASLLTGLVSGGLPLVLTYPF